MQMQTPQSAVLSAVIFKAPIIVALIPLAPRGVKYLPMNAEVLLRTTFLSMVVAGRGLRLLVSR
jgi:potassium-transporting ATPase ATP-binding subunit